MASPEIELRRVSLEFEDKKVLKCVDLRIEKGEIFVLLGPSGEGKSVLLKIMAGILSPTQGSLWIEGHDFHAISAAERDQLRRKMGMLFQKNALFDSLTSGDNISFPLIETTTKTPDDIQQIVDEQLSAVGIAHAKNLYPDEISGGMQKRLGIARALALEPEIIFYDDPTAGLDPITSRRIVDLILKLQKQKGSTVVAITNDINRAFQMGTRLAMVVDGELIITGSPEETKRHKDPRVQQFISGSLSGPLTSRMAP